VKERRFSAAYRGSVNAGFSPGRLLKNSGRISVLKGRGFQPRRKCRKINSGFSR
jgi:hypothetical protein